MSKLNDINKDKIYKYEIREIKLERQRDKMMNGYHASETLDADKIPILVFFWTFFNLTAF